MFWDPLTILLLWFGITAPVRKVKESLRLSCLSLCMVLPVYRSISGKWKKSQAVRTKRLPRTGYVIRASSPVMPTVLLSLAEGDSWTLVQRGFLDETTWCHWLHFWSCTCLLPCLWWGKTAIFYPFEKKDAAQNRPPLFICWVQPSNLGSLGRKGNPAHWETWGLFLAALFAFCTDRVRSSLW